MIEGAGHPGGGWGSAAVDRSTRQADAVLVGGSFDGTGESAQQVPPVGHLDRVGCRAGGGLAEGAAPISADDLDFGVIGEPGSNGASGAVEQEIDRPSCSTSMRTLP